MVHRGGATGQENARTHRGPRVGLGAILAATALGACLGVGVHVVWPEVGAAGDALAPEAQVAGAQLERGDEPNELQRAALDGVLLVEASGCGEQRQASATVVRGPAGDLLLTNAHVVRGSGTVTVRSGDGTVRTADVVGAVVGRDAAVLRLSDEGVGLDALPTAAAPGQGVPVAVLGYPAAAAEVRVGRVATVEVRSGYGGSSEVLVIDTPTGDGQSGGAVLDVAGNVVGLVAARDPSSGDTVAYPIDVVLRGSLGPVPTC